MTISDESGAKWWRRSRGRRESATMRHSMRKVALVPREHMFNGANSTRMCRSTPWKTRALRRTTVAWSLTGNISAHSPRR